MKHKMIFVFIPLLIASLVINSAASVSSNIHATQSDVVTIYAPGDNISLWGSGVGYPRIMEVQHNGNANGTLLATFEVGNSGLSQNKPGYPIYKSTDGGKTWSNITTVRETMDTSLQSEWQMFLFELPRKVGNMPAGTILLAAVSIDSGHSTKSAIRIYRSYDVGNTWTEYSTVTTGGGLTSGVWEPYIIMLDDGRLVCYYSDSTDYTHHSQMLSYCVSSDGVNWGTPVHIVALNDRTLRPGMATVCRMNNGKYFMTYEMVDEDNPNSGNKVTYRFSNDALNWGDPTDPGTVLQTSQGYIPGSAPYSTYIPGVGKNGLLIVRACFQSPSTGVGTYLYVNDNYGQGKWETMAQPLRYTSGGGRGYSAGTFLSSDGVTLYLMNAVENPASTKNYNKIVFTKLNFSATNASTSTSSKTTAATTSSSAVTTSGVSSVATTVGSAETTVSAAVTTSAATTAAAGESSAAGATTTESKAITTSNPHSGGIAWILVLVIGICLIVGEAAVAFVLLKRKRS